MYNLTTCTYFAKKSELAKKYHFISQVKEKISKFESIESGMISNPVMFLCVHQLYKLIWKLNNPHGPFKQSLANIVINNPKQTSININSSKIYKKYGLS